jgi:hypothetical protein
LLKHAGVVADDCDNELNCVVENGRDFHAPSFRYVEDESSEWSDLDYKLKVPDNHTSVTLFSNILVNLEPDLTFLRWAILQHALQSSYCSGVVVSFPSILCLIR